MHARVVDAVRSFDADGSIPPFLAPLRALREERITSKTKHVRDTSLLPYKAARAREGSLRGTKLSNRSLHYQSTP